jgi:hypothetical protein
MLRQAFLLAVMCLWPLFFFAALTTKRRILLTCVGLFLAIGWVLLSISMLQTNIRLWNHSNTPYTPFRVGPSMYSLGDLSPWLGFFIWLPSLVIYILIRAAVRWRKRQDLMPRAVFSFIIIFSLLGLFWGWVGVGVTEYDHEDTVWSDDFTFRGWEQVKPGMTRDQVLALLGQPFQEPIGWGYVKGEEKMDRFWWVRNWSAGYFAVVWFDEGRVHRKQFWYSD